MTVGELSDACAFPLLAGGGEREITGAYAGDLISLALSAAAPGDAWFTVMGNINAVAVAWARGCACLVLCGGVALDSEALERARERQVPVLTTELPIYEAVTLFNSKTHR